MEILRQYYEIRQGKRVSDSHWSKVKNRLLDANLSLTESNLNNYLEIIKYCPRYRESFKFLANKLKNFADYLGLYSHSMRGDSFCYYLYNQDIKPKQSTISRWFQPVGGFRKSRVYTSKELSIVAISAFIYQVKQEVSQ